MKDTRRLYFLWVAPLLLAAMTPRVLAHDLAREVLMYVDAQASGLRVLVRIPVAFLTDVPLPVGDDGYLDLKSLAETPAPLSAIASEVVRNLDMMDDGRPLPSPRTSWKISERSDSSFETYDRAIARFEAQSLAEKTRLDPSAVVIDLRLDYPIVSDARRFSMRVNGMRTSDRAGRTEVRYVTDTGETRRFVTEGEPRRIALEPRWQSAGALFARLGIEQLSLASLPLLFVFALAIPRRAMRMGLAALGAFAVGCVFSLIASRFLLGPTDPSRVVIFHTTAAAALVVAALQNITAPGFRWVLAASAIFGLLDGLVLGASFLANAPLAGSHSVIALASFVVPVLVASLWLFLIAHSLIGLVHRLTPTERPGLLAPGPWASPLGDLPRRWAIILLSAAVIHAGLHGLVGQ